MQNISKRIPSEKVRLGWLMMRPEEQGGGGVMAAELKHLGVVGDPLIFECFCESHDDKEKEY